MLLSYYESIRRICDPQTCLIPKSKCLFCVFEVTIRDPRLSFQNLQNELPGVLRDSTIGTGLLPLRPSDTMCLGSDAPFES